MKSVNHLNYFSSGNLIYCESLRNVVEGTPQFYDENCLGCPYLAGHLQGNGIECKYEDSLAKDEPFVVVLDPDEYQVKRQKVRSSELELKHRKFLAKKK